MATDDSSLGGPPGLFASTHWSVVLEAGVAASPQADAALDQLCRIYWYPLYAYVRRRGFDAHEAQDLTQEFLARLIAKCELPKANPEKGRFRFFLLLRLKHFLVNEWQRLRAEKRGGGVTLMSLNALDALPWLGEALRLDAGSAVREASHRMRLQAVLRQAPQLDQLWFHDNFARQAVFSPDGSRVATCGDDAVARIWNVSTGQPVTLPLPHARTIMMDGVATRGGQVKHIAFDSSGKRLVTSWNFSARVWDSSTGQPVGRELTHDNTVHCAFFSPDGKLVLTASDDRTARLWNAISGEPLGEAMSHTDAIEWAVFSPDGSRIATAGRDHVVRIWSTATQQPYGPPLNHEDGVSGVVPLDRGELRTIWEQFKRPAQTVDHR